MCFYTFLDINEINLYVINAWDSEKLSSKLCSGYSDFLQLNLRLKGVDMNKTFVTFFLKILQILIFKLKLEIFVLEKIIYGISKKK